MWIDAHNHLGDSEEGIRATILQKTAEEKPVQFFCNTISPGDWGKVAALAKTTGRVFPFFGIHPWFADKIKTGWEAGLLAYLKEPESGVGEIGLDRVKKDVAFEKQEDLLKRQVEIACSLRKPFAVHCVRAWGELLGILRPRLREGARFLLHAFRGPKDLVPELVQMGAYFSFSWKRLKVSVPEGICEIPEDRLLIETDFPYLGKEKTGEPVTVEDYFVYLTEAYRTVARLRGVSVDQLEKVVSRNGSVFLYGNPAR